MINLTAALPQVQKASRRAGPVSDRATLRMNLVVGARCIIWTWTETHVNRDALQYSLTYSMVELDEEITAAKVRNLLHWLRWQRVVTVQ